MSRNSKTLGKLLTLTLLTSVACYADLIGPFSISGTATVSATGIDFSNVSVLINTPSDDSNPTLGSPVNIGNLTEPIGVPINVPDWLTTTTSIANPTGPGDVAMDLTFLPTGVFPMAPIGTPPCGTTGGAPGDTCTPIVPNSPTFVSNLDLLNTRDGFSASFDSSGTALDKDTNTLQFFRGTFSADSSSETYQSALATIAGGGSVTVPFSAKFTFTAIPEPTYLPILGGAAFLGGLAVFFRRKTRTI